MYDRLTDMGIVSDDSHRHRAILSERRRPALYFSVDMHHNAHVLQHCVNLFFFIGFNLKQLTRRYRHPRIPSLPALPGTPGYANNRRGLSLCESGA